MGRAFLPAPPCDMTRGAVPFFRIRCQGETGMDLIHPDRSSSTG